MHDKDLINYWKGYCACFNDFEDILVDSDAEINYRSLFIKAMTGQGLMEIKESEDGQN